MHNPAPAPPFPPTEEFIPVGLAGRLFDKALAEAGLDRKSLFGTNAVNRCLEAELEFVKPEGVLLLGTAPLAPVVFATAHPSSVLRAPDEAARREAYRALVADLRIIAETLRSRPARRSRPAAAAVRQRQLSLLQ